MIVWGAFLLASPGAICVNMKSTALYTWFLVTFCIYCFLCFLVVMSLPLIICIAMSQNQRVNIKDDDAGRFSTDTAHNFTSSEECSPLVALSDDDCNFLPTNLFSTS